MAYVSSNAGSAGKPMVKALFVASCLLSIVSWYTTMQGMALYLSTWFALLASLGVQVALVFVAWLAGFSKTRRGLLIAVYAITATVSIAFSYVSLYTWFSARDRPALIQRQLFDSLAATSQATAETLQSAAAEGRKHALALEHLAAAEKSHGYMTRADDADPYVSQLRDVVGREAKSYGEGTGEGPRYSAFERYAKLATQSSDQLDAASRGLAGFRSQTKPTDPTDTQLRQFHQAFDAVPWAEVETTLHRGKLERPAAPAYADFVDKTSSGQEDLLIGFTELFTAPTPRHFFCFALAAFIDIIVFLLAFASGPYFFGSPEEQWMAAGAAIESMDNQLFARDLLRKVTPGANGMGWVAASRLTPGELQICILLAGKGMATVLQEHGETHYALDPKLHESIVESLATRGVALRAATHRAATA